MTRYDNAAYQHLKDAMIRTNYEIEQALGKVLGYPELYPIVSKIDDGAVCVGEMLPELLAVEAARVIEQQRAVLIQARDVLKRFSWANVDLVCDCCSFDIDGECNGCTTGTKIHELRQAIDRLTQ